MKTFLITSLLITAVISSCTSDGGGGIRHISGEQSAFGEVGAKVSVPSGVVEGVGAVSGTVSENKDGVSTIVLSAVVTDPALIELAGKTRGFSVEGNVVTGPALKIKATDQGFESISPAAGVLVKFDSKVGDRYPIAGSGTYRTVTHVSTDNDYNWGGMNIKVIKVEVPLSSKQVENGMSKVVYYANHRWGIVGLDLVLTEGGSYEFPVTLTP